MRNKITIDMEKESGYDCECIVSEGDGKNTLELYMWNVGSNPSIEISWVKGGGSGDESRYDVNGDGEITHEDAVEILNHYVTDGGYEYKYDMDLDGYVSPKDAYLVQNKVAGIVDPEESGSAVVEGVFLDNGDYYCSIPLEYISGFRTVTVKVKWSGFESKPIYFNCININENTDFIVTRNLSCDDTYTVIAAIEETLQIATKDTPGVVKVGNGLTITKDGMLSAINSGEAMTEYEYISANSVKYNGVVYTITKDSSTRLISKIIDSNGNYFMPKINGGISTEHSTFLNAVFLATAMCNGFVNTSIQKPIIELLFNDGLKNTGTGEYTIEPWENSAEILYEDGLNGKCYSATNKSAIKITDVSTLLSGDFTIMFWTKINDTGLPPNYQWRRFVYAVINNVYFGAELSYSGTTSTNKPGIILTNGGDISAIPTAINDSAWHSIVIAKAGDTFELAVDEKYQVFVYHPISTTGNFLTISHINYSLNGYISSFRVFDKALDLIEREQMLSLK